MTTENKKNRWYILFAIMTVITNTFLFQLNAIAKPQAKEVIKITAVELFTLYEKNEVAADEKFKGSYIDVTGVIGVIEKDYDDRIVIRLRTNNWKSARVSMYMSNTQKGAVAQLKRDQKVVIRCGEMKGEYGSPTGKQCVLIAVLKYTLSDEFIELIKQK